MSIYMFGMILSVFFAFVSKSLNNENVNQVIRDEDKPRYVLSKYSKVCSFLPLLLISAIRYDVGTDYMARYVPGFENIAIGYKETFEIGFKLLNKFILIFSNDYVWLFIVTSFIFCFFTYKAIYEQSEDVSYSIILLVATSFFFLSLNLVRQCISIAIFLYATKYIKSSNLKKYVILILIATSLHYSAMVYIPVYFICKKKVAIEKQILTMVCIILSMPLVEKFIYSIIGATKYFKYIGSIYDTNEFSLWGFIINISILIFSYIFYQDNKDDSEYNIFVNIQFIATILLLCSSIVPHVDRIVIAFTASQIIFLPKILNSIKKEFTRHVIKTMVICFYFIIMIDKIVIKGNNEVLPYITIFSR